MATIISSKTTGGGGASITGDTSGILQLASADGTTAVTIDASQNVGIGATPIAGTKLIVNGGYTAFQFNSGTGPTYPTYNSYFGAIGTNFQAGSSYLDFWNTVGSGFQWHIQTGASTQTSVLTIDGTGNVLVGTTSGVYSGKLSVSYLSASQRGICVLTDSVGTTAQVSFNNPNGAVGQITTTGSTTLFTSISDYRLKDNVAPMIGALAKVALLKPCTYKWKVDGSDSQGFIAHELAEVEAGCVTGEKDAVDAEGNPQYQGIDTSFLVATLTSAIQELKAIIDTQQTRIIALEAK